MIVILSIGVIFSILVCGLIYRSQASKAVKAGSLTALILIGLFTFDHYNKNIGTPVQNHPSYEFVYVHHVLEGDTITLWVKHKETLNNRLHIFPYNRDIAKKLQQAQESKAKGQEQQGKFKKGSTHAPGLELDNWQGAPDVVPKDP